MKPSENYRAELLDELRRDPEYAAEYLSSAKADSNEAFLIALRDVVEAGMGMKNVARAAKLNRESLYRALSRQGNPSIDTLDSLLSALGIEIRFAPKTAMAPPKGRPRRPSRKTRVRRVTRQR